MNANDSVRDIPLAGHAGEMTVPDFIYNRFDLLDGSDARLLCLEAEEERYAVPARLSGRRVELGLWMAKLPEAAWEKLVAHAFSTFKGAEVISYQNALSACGDVRRTNHFSIDLPEDPEKLSARLSAKGRYNIRRERRLLDEAVGGLELKEYARDDVPEEVIERYFEMKLKTHDMHYHMSTKEYLRAYHITHVYALCSESEVIAEVMSCEQCPVMYIENLTYNQEYARYSPGQVIYDMYLRRLCEKGRRALYLGGGQLDYKRRYGSVEDAVYFGEAYRNGWVRRKYALKRALRDRLRRAYHKIRGMLR